VFFTKIREGSGSEQVRYPLIWREKAPETVLFLKLGFGCGKSAIHYARPSKPWQWDTNLPLNGDEFLLHGDKQPEIAASILQKAILLAEPEGYVRSFIGESEVYSLLRIWPYQR